MRKTNPQDQTETLNNQFHSAFTRPKPLKLSHICELKSLKSTTKNLNLSKAIGQDKSSPHILKDAHHKISHIITHQ